jgi:hypothetical protein
MEKEICMGTLEIVLLAIESGFALGVIVLIFKIGAFAKETKLGFLNSDSRFDCLDKKIDKIAEDLTDVKIDIRRLDARISHIEGYLLGRDFRNGTENR